VALRVRRGSYGVRRGFRVRRGSRVRRGFMLGRGLIWCGVASGCGAAQIIALRLAVRKAEFESRLGTSEEALYRAEYSTSSIYKHCTSARLSALY
jgi:hypothetical protein